ncbi:MAG TPA: LON peptidase substrate-binding domain-containing protein [Pelomicrobium sp.]|nr:LON peptidase substrate-binding domain-containing protein [Pelomicrobium sp.]
MTERTVLPLFPLGTVLFPRGRLPLKIFEQRYLEMTKRCIAEEAPFGVCLILEGGEVGTPALTFDIGCSARIRTWDMPTPGLFHLMTEGERRFRVLAREVDKSGLLRGEVEWLPEDAPAPLPAEHAVVADLLRQVVEQAGEDVFAAPHAFDDAAWAGYRLAEVLPITMASRQHLLEMDSARARLDALIVALRQLTAEADAP